jgi:hypothetical protein
MSKESDKRPKRAAIIMVIFLAVMSFGYLAFVDIRGADVKVFYTTQIIVDTMCTEDGCRLKLDDGGYMTTYSARMIGEKIYTWCYYSVPEKARGDCFYSVRYSSAWKGAEWLK